MKKKFITVAIDSPAAAGAGTQSKLIAKHYNLFYLDTGKIADRHRSFQKLIRNYLDDQNKKNEFFLRYNFISTWSKMMKKEFMNKHNIKFDEGPMGAEDVMLSTKIGYFMKSFEVCSDVIYCLITRYGSSTRTYNEFQFDIRLNARISRIKFLN